MGPKKNYSGFVRRADSLYKPGDLLLASTVGGPQYEHRFEIRWFEGNWWLAYQGDWIGYYPGYLFGEMSSYACELQWYMEVYDGTPEDWTYTDGGSGEFAQYGYPYAAYFNQIYYLDIIWQTHWLFAADAWASGPYDPACYTGTPLEVTWMPGSVNRFYCSGPGKDPIKAPDCH